MEIIAGKVLTLWMVTLEYSGIPPGMIYKDLVVLLQFDKKLVIVVGQFEEFFESRGLRVIMSQGES